MRSFLDHYLIYMQAVGIVLGIVASIVTLITFYRAWRSRLADRTIFAFPPLPIPSEADSIVIDFDDKKKKVPGTFEHAVAQYENQLTGVWKSGMLQYPEWKLSIAKELYESNISISKWMLIIAASVVFIATLAGAMSLDWSAVFMIYTGASLIFGMFPILLLVDAQKAKKAALVSSNYMKFLAENGISIGSVFTRQKRKQDDQIVPPTKAA